LYGYKSDLSGFQNLTGLFFSVLDSGNLLIGTAKSQGQIKFPSREQEEGKFRGPEVALRGCSIKLSCPPAGGSFFLIKQKEKVKNYKI